MPTINDHLYGQWKMNAMRFLNSEKKWESEKVVGGQSVFTKTGAVTTFTRTEELAFGYSGKFVIRGDEVVTKVDVCSIEALEGKTITRTVKKVNEKALTLGMTDEATGREYEIEFELITRSFV